MFLLLCLMKNITSYFCKLVCITVIIIVNVILCLVIYMYCYFKDSVRSHIVIITVLLNKTTKCFGHNT